MSESRPVSKFLRIAIIALWAVLSLGVLLTALIGPADGWSAAAAWVALSAVLAILFGLTLVRGVA